jgi:signal transduction histidine kinase
MKAALKPLNWKLKHKVIFHVLVIGLMSGIGLTLLFIKVEKDLILQLTEEKTEIVGNMIEGNIRHQMLEGDTESLSINLQQMIRSGTIARLRILDLNGKILTSSEQQEVGASIPPADTATVARLYSDPDQPDLFAIKPVSRTMGYIAIRNRPECRDCHAPEDPFNGILEVKLDESLEAALLQRSRFQGSIIALATLVILTFVIYRLYERVINRPLIQLKRSMKLVMNGDLNIHLETRKQDEFGDLANSFNDMVHKLKEANRKIAELHDRQIEKAGHLASLGELAAGLAHEIKNPIAGIKGSLEIIRDRTPEDDPQREIFSEILKQTERIYHIIQDLLDYAKPKELSMRPADPNACVQEAINLAHGLTQDKDIRFHFEGLDKDPTVVCDADKLQEVVLNLLINSIAAIDKAGDITVDLDLVGDERMEVRITDTGSGIKPERMDKIFQPFFTTRKHGTGLGLSICKQIVEAHRGEITVHSTLGQGTAFTLSLPLNPQVE